MRKHTKRTVRPLLDPMVFITKRAPLASDQQRDIGIAYHASLQAILRGHGNEQAWCTLSCSLNIALMLCEQGFSAGHIEDIKRAQTAMISCRTRAEIHNKYGFTGDEARLVMAACNIHDEQISHASRAQITEAIHEVHQRIEIGEIA
ncbi:MAG: hypothetical protein WC710_14685 [Gallionella sp.]|jgi:hypothetical protein